MLRSFHALIFATLTVATILYGGPQIPKSDRSPSLPDSIIPKRNMDLEMAVLNSAPFADAAEKQGISVSSDEVNRRVEVLRKISPDQEVVPGKVKRILLAEKYLEIRGVIPKELEHENPSQVIVGSNPLATADEVEHAKKAARYQALFGQEGVRRVARKLEDRAQLERRSKHNAVEIWPVRDLQVQSESEECLARNAQGCIVSVREYNAATLHYNLPSHIPLDSAKIEILRNYLLERHLADSARMMGLDRNPDSLLRRESLSKQWSRWIQSAKTFGVPVKDAKSLQMAYDRYYHQYFAPSERVTLAVIGSSDSSYIDSIHRVFSAWDRNRELLKNQGETDLKEPRLPWRYFNSEELPEEFLAVTDTFRVGQCSKPYRFQFGFFIVRLTKVVPKPEIPFKDAFACLMYLATRDKYMDNDSIVEAAAKQYYLENLSQFALPDTMDIQTWLVPYKSKDSRRKPYQSAGNPFLADTTEFKATLLSSLSLPSDARAALHMAIRKDTLSTFVGPFPDRFGLWYFKILTKKLSHKVLPYRLARREILQRITAPLPEKELGLASDEAQEEVLLNRGLAQAYRRASGRNQVEKSRQDRSGLVKGASNLDGLSEVEQTKARELIKGRIHEEQRRNRERMDLILKEAKVNLDRLVR